MTRHLFPPAHLPHPRIAEHVSHLFEAAVDHLHGEPRWHEPAARIVPVAADWPEWHHYTGGKS